MRFPNACVHAQTELCPCTHMHAWSKRQCLVKLSRAIYAADRICKNQCLSLFMNQVMSPQSHWGLNPSRAWPCSCLWKAQWTKDLRNMNSSKPKRTGPQLNYTPYIRGGEINKTYFSEFSFHFGSRSKFRLWKIPFYQLLAHTHWWFWFSVLKKIYKFRMLSVSFLPVLLLEIIPVDLKLMFSSQK